MVAVTPAVSIDLQPYFDDMRMCWIAFLPWISYDARIAIGIAFDPRNAIRSVELCIDAAFESFGHIREELSDKGSRMVWYELWFTDEAQAIRYKLIHGNDYEAYLTSLKHAWDAMTNRP